MLCWLAHWGKPPGVSLFRSFPSSGEVIFLTSLFSLQPRGFRLAARLLRVRWESRLRGLSPPNQYGHPIPLRTKTPDVATYVSPPPTLLHPGPRVALECDFLFKLLHGSPCLQDRALSSAGTQSLPSLASP